MLSLHDREWKEFDLREVFPHIQRGKRLKSADHINGNTPYVSSSAMNNGVDNFVSNEHGVRKFSDCLTLANSGSVGKTFYHGYEFVASDHVTALQSHHMNKYSYIFVATLVERLQEKYSFNREINDLLSTVRKYYCQLITLEIPIMHLWRNTSGKEKDKLHKTI